MRFPPPARYYAPLLVLVFGLAVTWLDYQLNVANDLARNLKDVVAQAEATGTRLARRSTHQLERGEPAVLAEDLAAWAHEPWLRAGALVNKDGVVMDASDKQWVGREALETPLSPAMRLVGQGQSGGQTQEADGAQLFGAYPFPMGNGDTSWVLIVFDRAEAMAQAEADAGRQLRWEASAITFLCFCLWAALHFGFAARLARLAQSVRDFGEGRAARVEVIPGGDEVHALSQAFAVMGTHLQQREADRVRLEREIIEASERERRRIGSDLHDGLGQQLTAISLASSALITALESVAPKLIPQAEQLSGQIRETIATTRALSHGLSPVALQDDGLMHALRALTDSTERTTQVRCVFECPVPVRIPEAAVAGHLYRIAQEAVNNALKHSHPGEIRIGLERRHEAMVLEVDDDGEGIPESSLPRSGIGLELMRHRAQLAGGSLEIGSAPAGGTRIACTIPVPA